MSAVAAVRRTRVASAGRSRALLQAGPADAARGGRVRARQPRLVRRLGARSLGAVGASGLRAVALDLPDFGETLAPPGFVHDVPGYATFLGEALDVLGVERVHLVIHDFGGPIGLVWAAMNVDAVASVTLIDTGILPGYRWHRLARIWRTAGARRAVPGDRDARARSACCARAASRAGCRARSSTRCTTTTTAARAARC